MTLKRTYVIKFTTLKNEEFYIKELIKYDLGYRFMSTKHINLAGIWKNKKSINKAVEEMNNGIFQPGFDKDINRLYVYEVVEVTPKKLLRLLKLKKIMKKS